MVGDGRSDVGDGDGPVVVTPGLSSLTGQVPVNVHQVQVHPVRGTYRRGPPHPEFVRVIGAVGLRCGRPNVTTLVFEVQLQGTDTETARVLADNI